MDITTLESLVAELISVNGRILDRLDDIHSELSEVGKEMNWIEELSAAKQVLDRLESIDSNTSSLERLDSIDTHLGSIDSNINFSIDLNTM